MLRVFFFKVPLKQFNGGTEKKVLLRLVTILGAGSLKVPTAGLGKLAVYTSVAKKRWKRLTGVSQCLVKARTVWSLSSVFSPRLLP